MPRQTQIEKTIPDLYKRSALRLLMFGYVRGVRDTVPTVTIERAIIMFMDHFGLDHDSFNIDSAKNIYSTMQTELFQTLKSK